MMINKVVKLIRFINYLILFVLIFNINCNANGWVTDGIGYLYIDANNSFVKNTWRWIDSNDDGIAECYRFGPTGYMYFSCVTKDGKNLNGDGQWVIDGVVQQIYLSTGKPYLSNTDNDIEVNNASISNAIINASNNNKTSNSPKIKNVDDAKEKGYIVGKKVNLDAPKGGDHDKQVLDSILIEDAPRVLGENEELITGRNMINYISASENYSKVDKVKIYGGNEWKDVICLAGNGAYVKFQTAKGSLKNNYMRFEISHQTHTDATSDTYCGLELYLDNKLICTYDSFCDGEPEVVEEYLDEGESTVTLKVVCSGDTTARKVYIRNARYKFLREKDD